MGRKEALQGRPCPRAPGEVFPIGGGAPPRPPSGPDPGDNIPSLVEVTIDIAPLRSLFPVCADFTYLNNAAESPLNERVRESLEEYTALASRTPHKKRPVREAVREALADLLGGLPQDYALVTSTGVGIGMAAQGYDWRPGDNVVVPMDEHWNATFPWLALRDRGVDCRLVPVGEDERVDLNEVAARVDDNTRILVTTAVRFNTGFRADLKALSEMAHRRDALFLVDGIQAAGVCPMDVETEGIDVLAAGGFKWLLGMHGTGFFYVNERARNRIRPVLPGMYAAEHNTRALNYHPDARRYETGTLAYAHFHAWPAGLGILQEMGVGNIHRRVMALTGRLVAGLREWGISVVSPVEREGERSGIVSFSLGSEEENKELLEKLKREKILAAFRDGRIRVSPNFFNNEDDIDALLSAL